MKNRFLTILAATAAATFAASAHAGYYQSINVFDGDFAEWATVPVATTASANTGTTIDFASLKIANDADNVYFLLTFNTPVNPQTGSGVFTAIDSDNSVATGFNVFTRNEVGANFAFQNNFPFTQSAGNFNTGGTAVNATYLASPYNTVTTQQEIAIPLTAAQIDASVGGYTGLIFTPTFTVEFYSDIGSGDTLGPVQYSLAVAPEPATLGAIVAFAGVALRRRRRA